MNSENLKSWALIAEIIGGVAVVLSLIFVGYQIRQSSKETALNTVAVETQAFSVLSDSISNLNQIRIDHAEFEALRQRALANDPTITPVEEGQFRAWMQMTLRLMELAHLQYQNGIIDEATLISISSSYRHFFRRSKISLDVWDGARDRRRPEFVEYFETVVKDRVGNCEDTEREICAYWQRIDPGVI